MTKAASTTGCSSCAPTAAGAVAIACEGLTVRFSGSTVLDDVTFTVPQGAYMGLLGPNGGGKTTLLKVLLGLVEPNSGSVRIFGESPSLARARGRMGYVPQRVTQLDAFPATANEVVWSGRHPRMGFTPTAADHAAVENAFASAGVAHLRTRLISRLSGGERQRVFIARALAAEPRILFLDEPLNGVDPPSREQFSALLRTLHRDCGMTIVVVSHDIDAVANEATLVACLNQKMLCCCGAHQFLHDATLQEVYGEGARLLRHTH